MATNLPRLVTRILAGGIGGVGIFALWASFYIPVYGAKAFLMLAAAAGITLAFDR
ncbi:MAG: hypothetical protein ACREFA_07390 [Stellaceae bacterium]